MYHFKSKDSEIKYYTLCLGNNVSIFFINVMKKSRIKRKHKFFSADFNDIDANDILDSHKYLMRET